MDILTAARTLRPGTAWVLQGSVLSQAIDGTPRVTVPSKEELDTCMAKEAHVELRRAAYPPIGDQLDAIWKGPDHPDFIAMKEQVDAIKARFPKGA